jgi:uncharacterized protein (DUF58 family)
MRARGARQGESRSVVRGRAIEFADYRPYVPGDEPRLLDWRAYGRLGRLYLKQQEEERARSIAVLVDASASMDWGEGEAHKGTFARKIAAAIVWIAVSHGELVTVQLLDGGSAYRLPPSSNRSGAIAIFRRLGETAGGGRTDLAASVHAALGSSQPGPTFLVSDLLEPGWPVAIEALASRREAAVVQTLAPLEWEPEEGDEVELVDAESGDVVETRLGLSELSAYRARLDQFLRDVRRECGRLGVAYAAVNSGSSLRDVLFRELPAAGVLH